MEFTRSCHEKVTFVILSNGNQNLKSPAATTLTTRIAHTQIGQEINFGVHAQVKFVQSVGAVLLCYSKFNSKP